MTVGESTSFDVQLTAVIVWFVLETSKPHNVQHLLADDGSLRISWDPPAIYCHLITNYEVTQSQKE